MLLKKLTKNPILAIGIIMMGIYLMGIGGKTFFKGRAQKLMPTSCRAVRVMLDRRIPATWSTACEGNNLAVTIDYINNDKKLLLDPLLLKKIVYRELANNFVHISKNSPSDNLEKTNLVRIKLKHKLLEVNAVTDGKFLIKMATIKDNKMLMHHLQATVQVKETIK